MVTATPWPSQPRTCATSSTAGSQPTVAEIGAGHAVLASHTGSLKDDHPRAGDGFVVLKFRNGKDGKLYDYATARAIPALIAGDLKTYARPTDTARPS